MKYIPILVTVLSTVLTAVAAPQFIEHHPTLYAVLNALAMVMHAVMPSTSTAINQKAANGSK